MSNFLSMKKTISLIFFVLSTIILSAQSYEDMVSRAMDCIEQEEYVAAELALKAALRKEPANPNNMMLMVNLGTIQRNLGKLEEALISYNVAVEKYPTSSFIRHNRAALYCEMNKFADAMLDYEAILIAEPNDIDALYRRGLLHMSDKNLLAAEMDFEKIREIAPENLYGKMGQAAIMKRRQEWKEAEELYSDLIAKYKASADLYFQRAECYLRMNKLARTGEDIKKALELGYEDSSIYIMRGQLRLAQKDKIWAKEDFLKAKEMGANAEVIEDFLRLCK